MLSVSRAPARRPTSTTTPEAVCVWDGRQNPGETRGFVLNGGTTRKGTVQQTVQQGGLSGTKGV